ncbi:GNAT family N-acetyltransferase [Paenibacillus paeoniae]|uniref:GNAT family N-acetyltransferase n=2 Tax=Paenibacillus paeoniae TaxID=2292705 RepID=A0A371P0L9_9BACL|nr:GNAT family N-acetyltransferase [Paenibacillus paeoniae]REK69473.1 GNAT family N-acetyltransferase [Paenibacillus paeoniae]
MTIQTMTEEHARELCEWRYAPPWDIYNWASWESMKKDGVELGDPVLRTTQYGAVVDERGSLFGYVQFFPLGHVTRLGLGLHPDRLGQGLGALLVRTIVEEALRRSPGNEVDLEVASWNTRAIRVYESVGFRIDETYDRPTSNGEVECHCMIYDPSLPCP